MDETPEQKAEREAAERLQASLNLPPVSQPISNPSLHLSEMGAMRELLGTLVARVDQLAKTMSEQSARMDATMQTTEATVNLAQTMIAQIAAQLEKLIELNQRVETVAAALVKVDANLSEIVAALVRG